VEPAELSEQAGGNYLRIIRRHWLSVVWLTVSTAVIAFVLVMGTTRSYEASASVLVSPVSASDPSFIGTGAVIDSGDPARTVQTAAALIDSPQAADAAARAMGPGWSGPGIAGSTSVAPRGQSSVLAVTAKASSAALSARLADTFARAAVETRARIVQRNIASRIVTVQNRIARLSRTVPTTSPELQTLTTQLGELQAAQDTGGDPTLSVSQQAEPGSATGSPKWLIVLIAGLAGFAIGCIAALGVEYFSSRVYDPSEVTSLLSAPILAVLPKLRVGQKGGLSPKSLPPFAFEQVRMLKAQVGRRQGSPTVIMITSADAGDGKTTVAAALAAACTEGDQDVILLDLDLRAPGIARLLALDKATGDGAPTDWGAGLAEMLVPVAGLPHLRALATQPGGFASFDELMERLPVLLAEARQQADWVIVDTPPIGEVSDAVPIAGECDEVLVVVRPGHTDRSRLIVARDIFARIGVIPIGTVLVGQRQKPMAGRYYGYGYRRTNHGRPDRSEWLDGNRRDWLQRNRPEWIERNRSEADKPSRSEADKSPD
jgi:Mrp family chromosome partitioning ATPase/capsular polysaccharide biosynthesis protein